MKIRSALGALCAALALAVGLVVSVGTASANAPAFGGHGHGVSCTPVAGSTSCDPVTPGGHTLPACTVVAPATTCSDPLGGLGRGIGLGGHGLLGGGLLGNGLLGNSGLGLNGLLVGGNTIVVDGQSVDVCSYPQWDGPRGFFPHFGGAHGDFLREHAINQIRYQQLVAQANCGAGVQSINGLTLVNGQWIDLNSYGVVGGQQVDVCSYSTYNDFNQFELRRFGGRFTPFGSRFGSELGGGGWSRLRQQANCGPQVVVVPGSNTSTVVQSPPATVTEAAPAPAAAPEESAPTSDEAVPPLAGSGHYQYPTGPPQTGN